MPLDGVLTRGSDSWSVTSARARWVSGCTSRPRTVRLETDRQHETMMVSSAPTKRPRMKSTSSQTHEPSDEQGEFERSSALELRALLARVLDDLKGPREHRLQLQHTLALTGVQRADTRRALARGSDEGDSLET
ncbi:unnamed protein product [Prorocentrum cordatum]|uniref:Uncharacterized protein n=1 Tax=Prorocentrum cordatum TaxID=2364126 RepID=A0ABN9VLL0_9DINO|nr:unnamed protein product [Polarella glacialis]